ncbi:MAG: NADPH:quinone oxidoreductase family protein [Salinisphaeraceae bacterium]|nr:NADPH:quinone oxidoreductase family protein [Salinisphaeraceae bacterium]
MKALLCKAFGPPDTLVVEDIESPALGPTAVRVAVHACGVNFPDTLIIEGKYQFRAEPPFSPGGEVAGEIMEVGEKVKHLQKGDRIMLVTPYGGYAEEIVVPGMGSWHIPKEMDYVTAASLPMAYGTSLYALKQRGQLKSGETLLVLGAAGGVGLAAVQLGKCLGAKVIAAASTDEKLELCKRNGADEVINYSNENLKERVKALTGGQGADVIYDPVGGDLFQQCLSAVNWNGRILVIGFASGTIPEAAINRTLLKSSSIVGVFWGASLMREPQANMENFEQIKAWFEEGRIQPHVSQTYSLEEAAQAMKDMVDRKATGKLVVKVRD